MIKNFWYIKGDFHKKRSKRIGDSDVPALIPNPEKPSETLAGYGRTPVTVWQEKTGRKEREPAGLPARVDKFMENEILFEFLFQLIGYDEALKIIHQKIWYEMNAHTLDAAQFQDDRFFHNVQYFDDTKICHPDMVYRGGSAVQKKGIVDGIKIDLEKYFILEAKNANYFATIRKNSMVKGYDFDLRTWQGIPLKHYMQIQFQLALLEIEIAYLPLIYNTSQFQVWQIKANKKHQNSIMAIVDRMAWHIQNDTPPKELAINKDDIQELYPTVNDDYLLISGPEQEQAIKIATEYQHAADQEKRWKAKKIEAGDAMAVMLKDNKEIRDFNGKIASWTITKDGEKITALSKIFKDDLVTYRYLKRKHLIEKKSGYRSVKISYKPEVE